jgi:hypothetical protein
MPSNNILYSLCSNLLDILALNMGIKKGEKGDVRKWGEK